MDHSAISLIERLYAMMLESPRFEWKMDHGIVPLSNSYKPTNSKFTQMQDLQHKVVRM